jgi:F-type H+-transporting ATPase subunit b
MNHEETSGTPATHAEVQTASHKEGSGNPLMRIDPGMILWTWIVFIVLLVLLGKFAWKPILKVLDEREKKIRKALEDAEAARLALEEAARKQNQIIGRAEEEAITLIQRARESAANFAMDLKNKAIHDSEKLIEQAKRAIDGEKQKALAELRTEAAEIAIAATSKLLKANLDDERNRKLVKEFINETTQS